MHDHDLLILCNAHVKRTLPHNQNLIVIKEFKLLDYILDALVKYGLAKKFLGYTALYYFFNFTRNFDI